MSTIAQVRTGVGHAGSAVGGAVAAIAFMSSHSVDLYALWNQLNEIVAAITKFVALVTPFATAAWGVYKASTQQKLADLVADPNTVEVAEAMPVTPQVAAIADALKKG